MKSRDLTKESWRSLLSELVANQETVGQFKASGANPASFQAIGQAIEAELACRLEKGVTSEAEVADLTSEIGPLRALKRKVDEDNRRSGLM